MSSLLLNAQDLSTPFNIVARVDSFEKGAIFEKNFRDSGIFKDVVLSSVAGNLTSDGTLYKFTANISATLVVSEITKKDAKGEATTMCGKKDT